MFAASMELPAPKFKEWIDLQAAGSDYITTKMDPVKGKLVPIVIRPALERIRDWYRGKFFLYENSSESNEQSIADSILRAFTMAAKRRGCTVFCVDNMMTALMDTGDEEYRAQGVFMTKLKRFAIKYDAHVIVVAHPRKVKAGMSITQDDVGGTKYITNLASNVITVERPNLRIIKARDSGFTRLIECTYCQDSRRIFETATGDKYQYSWDKTGIAPLKGKDRADQNGYSTYTAPADLPF